MVVTARRPARRRPYGLIGILLLVALFLIRLAIPLSRGESLESSMNIFGSLFGEPVEAAESEEQEEPTGPLPGKIRVFVSGRDIPAYTKITRDDLWNTAKESFAFSDVPEDLIQDQGILVKASDIIGRVLSHTKSKGYAFTESDFLPKGTRPGISAGVPAGKRALRIDVEKVEGIIGLQPGDRFDMVSAQPLDQKNTAPQGPLGGVYSERVRQMAQQSSFRRARVQVLVQNGVVVTPLQTRLVPTTSSTLTRGTTTRTLPVQEMVIALEPDEVAPFMEALSLEASVICLARSGLPDDPEGSVTPSQVPEMKLWGPGFGKEGSDGSEPMRMIESINEDERTFVPVPQGTKGGKRDDS